MSQQQSDKSNFSPIKSSVMNKDTEVTYDNTIDDKITVIESKARLVYRDEIEKKSTGAKVLTYLGLFISCVTSLVTTEKFKDYGFIDGSVIKATFLLCTILFGVLTIKWLYNLWKYSLHDEDYFIESLRGNKEIKKHKKSIGEKIKNVFTREK